MTKTEMIKLYAEATGKTAAQAGEDMAKLLDIMVDELLDGGEVPLPRIGKLVAKPTPARNYRNLQTGEVVTRPAGHRVLLRVGKEFKEALQ